jgi:hypothetical protein
MQTHHFLNQGNIATRFPLLNTAFLPEAAREDFLTTSRQESAQFFFVFHCLCNIRIGPALGSLSSGILKKFNAALPNQG